MKLLFMQVHDFKEKDECSIHFLSQEELEDLMCNLDLSKRNARMLESHLQQKFFTKRSEISTYWILFSFRRPHLKIS